MPINDPTDIADLRLWLRADGFTGLSEDDPVSTWPDESGLGNDGVAPGGNEPLYKTAPAGLNGWPGLLFNEDIFNLPNLMSGEAAGEIFLVLKNDADPPVNVDSGIFRFGTAGTDDHHPFSDGNIYNGFGSNTRKNAGNPSTDLTNLHFVNIQSAAGSWIFRIDKASFFSTGSNTVAWTTTPRVGFSTSFDYRGYIVAVVLFARILTTEERSDMEDYLDRYLSAPITNEAPDTPTAFVDDVRDTEVDLSGSVYSDPDDDPHVASRWQVDFLGRDFTTPVFDSGEDSVNLLSITVEDLLPGSAYIARVAYSDGDAFSGFSGFSPVVAFTTSGTAPSGVSLLNCSMRLTAYDDDKETVLWQVSTDPGHTRPYLGEPEHYGEQELDIVQGGATISQVEVMVIDVPQLVGDQDSGWMTQRIVEGGQNAIFGRRFKLERFIDEDTGFVIIADGPAGTPRMDNSYAAYRWTIRDTRETERKLTAFTQSSKFSIFPTGLYEQASWGALPDATFLVPAIAGPAQATVAWNVADTRVTFNSLTPNDQILTQAAKDVCPFLITDFEFTVAPGSNQGYVGLFQNITLLWRYTGEGDEDWRTVFQPAYFGNIAGLSPFVPVFFRTGPGDVTAEVGEIIDRMVWSPRPEEEEPTDTLTVEFIVFFQGAISEQYPRLIDNITVGELIRDLYDGLHSPLDPVIGATEPSGILYDEAALLQMTDPVLLRLTESVDDARAWAESKGYAPSGWVPALDNQLLISPVSQVPPENFAGVRTINDNIAEATPDWNGGERVVNVLTFKYPRYYAPTDPTLSDGIDGILEREIVIEFRDEDSIRRFGEAKIEYDGRIFAAVGNANGDQVLTTQDETGRLLAGDRFTYVFERYRHAAQIITVPVRRAFSGDVRSGSFVIADLTWIPDYILQRRGGLFGGQVIAIRNVDCTWRVMTIEEILPLEQS